MHFVSTKGPLIPALTVLRRPLYLRNARNSVGDTLLFCVAVVYITFVDRVIRSGGPFGLHQILLGQFLQS
jgi:hypothetical protein